MLHFCNGTTVTVRVARTLANTGRSVLEKLSSSIELTRKFTVSLTYAPQRKYASNTADAIKNWYTSLKITKRAKQLSTNFALTMRYQNTFWGISSDDKITIWKISLSKETWRDVDTVEDVRTDGHIRQDITTRYSKIGYISDHNFKKPVYTKTINEDWYWTIYATTAKNDKQ